MNLALEHIEVLGMSIIIIFISFILCLPFEEIFIIVVVSNYYFKYVICLQLDVSISFCQDWR